MITGGVKTGKSTFSVALALRVLRRQRFKCKVHNFFARLFRRPDKIWERPVIYSNVPLKVPYVPVTRAILLRKKRLVFRSVLYLQEMSLVADSQLTKDQDINEQLLLFAKLFGHETHGGVAIFDTQSIGDNHYSIRRSLSEYFYIHHLIKFFPFFLVLFIREERYAEDLQIMNNYSEDVEESLKMVIVPKRVWKKFDCYCYSCLTDDLPVVDEVVDGRELDDLKARKIISFRQYKNNGSVKDNGIILNEKGNG